MSTPTNISMDDIYMDAVIKLYEEAETMIDDLITELDNTKDTLADGYEGLATSINEEGITKYKQHMEFLKICCQANRQQVQISKDNLTAAG